MSWKKYKQASNLFLLIVIYVASQLFMHEKYNKGTFIG